MNISYPGSVVKAYINRCNREIRRGNMVAAKKNSDKAWKVAVENNWPDDSEDRLLWLRDNFYEPKRPVSFSDLAYHLEGKILEIGETDI